MRLDDQALENLFGFSMHTNSNRIYFNFEEINGFITSYLLIIRSF